MNMGADMRRLTWMSVVISVLTGMLLLPAASAQSQPQSQSLGDYARSARKDKPQVAPARKFDNDNLPMNDKLSIVGKAPDSDQASEADQSAATDNAKTAD